MKSGGISATKKAFYGISLLYFDFYILGLGFKKSLLSTMADNIFFRCT